jgi:hypothetical protein
VRHGYRDGIETWLIRCLNIWNYARKITRHDY